MLAKANRVVAAADFRAIVRRGRRTSTASTIIYRVERDPETPARFGFIVAKTVGNAVTRNRVRRRMRAICRDIVDAGGSGSDVVVRALPSSSERGWDAISTELRTVLEPALIR